MNVLQVSPYLTRSAGGPAVSVSRTSQELLQQGLQVMAAGVTDEFSPDDAALWQPVRVQVLPPGIPRSYCYAAGFSRQIRTASPDLIHSHGLWLYPHLAAYRYCARNKVPLIVSPRGMLEPWAFRHRAWKKRPLWWAYEKRALQSARVLHATAEQEAEALRGLGFTNPIAIIPNGVDMPGLTLRRPAPDGIRTALFLSRLHPKKGLMNLVTAWSRVRPDGWRMVIAGPDEEGHEAELHEAVQRAGLQDVIEFVGPVYSERKESLYRCADLFILPSYSENFGIAVAEALANGIPVITTTGTPWSELVRRQCGWWVECGTEPLAAALGMATRLSDGERGAMGMRGRLFVEERFAWSTVACSMKSVYEWVLRGGSVPGCVRMD